MSYFSYRAKKGPREVVDGTIEAPSLEEAMDQLEAQGLLPVHLEEGTPLKSAAAGSESQSVSVSSPASRPLKSIPIFGGVKSSEVTLFSRQLASLLKAGVPILKALWIISEQSENPKFKKILSRTQEEVKNGRPLSSVLAENPKIFPPIYIAMVRTGEESGTLQEALTRLAVYRQRQEEIVSHIRAAMAYPALMALTGVGTIVFMLTFVIPRLTGLFASMGGHLPLPTRILIMVSSVFHSKKIWAAVFLLFFAAVIFLRTNGGRVRELWSRLSLRLFFVKDFVLKSEMARFSRTLELLIKCGVPILRGIEITTPVIENTVLRKEFERAGQELTGGSSLGASMRKSRVLPLFMTNLVTVGEESGKLDESMEEIASFYEKQTDEAIRIMTSLLEPIMILVMGFVVGFIVIAMLLPMFELNMIVR